MATTNIKKMSFSIENLAKSSRTEERHCDNTNGMVFINRNPWQCGDFTSVGDFTTGVYTSPYYTNNGHTSPSISPIQFHSPLGHLRESFRLSPDDGYSSQNSSPSVSGSCHKRKCIDAHHDVDVPNSSTPSVTGSSMKRKRLNVDGNRRNTHTPNDSLIDSSFESVCPTSDSDEGGDTPRPKKARTAFSNDQIEALERRYQGQKYLPAGERSRLASEHKLTDQQVKTWFQNRRMKEKRNNKDDAFPGGMPLPTGGVDISQLRALGIPCPPPYTINNKHQHMLRDDDIPNSPLSTMSPQSPLIHTAQHVPFYSRFQPMTHGLDNLPSFPSPTNQFVGYR